MIENCKKYKYQTIAEDIKMEIFLTHMKGNSPLPSIRNYADKYNVAPNTIVNALHLLRENRIVYTHRTKGYCVSVNIEEKRNLLANELVRKLITDIQQIGFTPQELLKLITEKMQQNL